jgi:uncharacterized protein
MGAAEPGPGGPSVRIVDAHHHVGSCRVFDHEQPEELVLRAMDQHGISATIVQPFPGAPNAIAVHDQIADLARRRPGRVFGLVSLNPHTDRDRYHAEASRCVRQLGFVGLKLHTIGHAVNPMGSDARTVFEVAHDLGVPVMVHTGPGLPFADPAMVLPRAREFPDVTVVLAHAGSGMFTGPAVAVAKACSNVVLETSWCRGEDIGWMIAELGPRRVMFGTDLVSNVATELAKYRSLGLTEEQWRDSLGRTAIEIFKLEVERGS